MNRNDRVRAAQAGDNAAFLALIEEQQDRMYRIAYYYVRQNMDAEDVVHEAIYKALVGLPKLKKPQFFATWLTRIVINCALTLLNKRQRIVPDGSFAAGLEQASAPETADRLDLLAAVRRLEPRQRQIIAFKYWHDMTAEEIAGLLRMPSGTVKTMLHRGLKALRLHYTNPEETIRPEQAMQSEASDGSEQERLRQKLVELKRRTEELFDIPQSYELTIEDYREDKREGGRAMLVWTKRGEDPVWSKPGQDTGISVELSDQGDLLEYSIDGEEVSGGHKEELTCDQLRFAAEKFVLDHYPDALKQFSLTRTQASGSVTIFFYEQSVMDMPLPLSGFRVKVQRNGIVSDFRYFGRQTKPRVLESIIPKEQLLRNIKETVKLGLQLAFIHVDVFDVKQDELRLVYKPVNRWNNYCADGKDDSTKQNDEAAGPEEEEVWLELPLLPEAAVVRTLENVQELLDIDPEKYELLREVEMDEQMSGVVWRRRGWKPAEPEDRSLDAFFRERSEDTIKAQFDRESGSLVSFIRFEDSPPGELRLSRNECLDIALRFLARTRPGLEPYLRLRHQEEEGDSDREHFDFRIEKQGVSLGTDHIRISVNKTAGRAESMIGPLIATAQLEAVEATPLLDEAKARQIYTDALDLKLEWQIDYSGRGPKRRYRLMYRQVHRDMQKEIRLIDARTGELICTRDF